MVETEPTPAERIERLEAEIDGLAETIRRSRRLVVVGRICAVVGLAWLAGLLFGIVAATSLALLLAIALALGGVVLMGSSVGSTRQFERALAQAQAQRDAAIDGLDLVELDRRR